MGYHNKLTVEILGDKNRAEVLRFLYRNRPGGFSQKQISMALYIPTATISRTCRKLENLNIVNRSRIGKTILYSLDEGSYVVRGFLLPVFITEEVFLKKLIEGIVSGLNPSLTKHIKEILVFGSVLNDEDTPASDIDLAVIMFGGQRAGAVYHDEAENIKEHFIYEAAKLEVRLDIHIFFDGERKKEKGISLRQVYEQGTIIWRSEDENSSQG